jgi:hypothetical protein
LKIKALLYFVLFITAFYASFEAAAQSDIALVTRKANLHTLSENLKKRDAADKQQAQVYARRVGIPLRRELPNGKVMELQRFSPGLGPSFYITNNLDAADTVSTLKVWPGGAAGLDLDGAGMTVGEWDGGAIYADHPDFIGRLTQMDSATTVSGHSTHVAGTLIGSGEGLEPRSRGMAYAAQLNAWDWNSDTAEMATAAAGGLLASNHSYGIAAGWIYIGDVSPNTWWWIGGAADTDVEDPYFGYYDTESQLWDQIAYDAPYYLIVKASGNDRSDTGPSAGEEYTVIDQNGDPLFTSTRPRNVDCAPAGYDCLPTNSVAKNVLTVGAVDDVPGGYSPLAGPSQVQMAPFSSWGPTDDGRIKPDVVGNGVFLISAWPDSPYYAAAAGTSMAAPNVTGSLLLLQQHYEDLHGTDNFMRSATLKALAIHTADEAGSAEGPDYAFGWGLLNTRAAATVITEDGGNHRIIEGSLADSANDTVQFSVSQPGSVLTATLVWMDPPGTPVALTLDSPVLMLKNDLDLRITGNSSTYTPWVLDPANPAAAATRGDNFRDNVEQIEINGTETGTYSIIVNHKGSLLNAVNQHYSLIISMTPAPPSGSNLLIDEDFSGGLPAGWSVSTITGINWTINSPVPGDSRMDNGTGGTGNFAMVDNGWVNQTVTSLQTPMLDLSDSSAVVLRFKSYYNYDTFESLNVDVSTNGGSNWANAWHFQGFNPLPSFYQLDLSGVVAGHSNVQLRFRFDSEGWLSGDFWQIDDVELDDFSSTPPPGGPPGSATNPNPANGGNGLALDTILWWSAGSLANSHDVYFGTDSTPDASESQGNQTGTTFDPGTLANDTNYYWRIDEVNDDGTTTGTVWSFTTEAAAILPGVSSNPVPASAAGSISTSMVLGWSAGSDTISHDVYFGTDNTPDAGEFQGNQTGTTFNPGTLANSTTYYWRIDEVNDVGTTTGTVWSFTTETATVLPGVSSSPNPANVATGVNINTVLGWTAGTDTVSHDVYFGTDSTPDAGESQGNQAGTTFDPGSLANSTTYYWRIDEVNGDGTTTGTVWSFTTEALTASAFHIASVSIIDEQVKGPRRRGVATITVRDVDYSPVSAVDINGTFSGDWNGSGSGLTDNNGQLVVQTSAVKNGSTWYFCIDSTSKTGAIFDADASATFLCDAPPPPQTSGSVTGIVTDAGDSSPIQGVSVSADSGQNTTTAADGSYTLLDAPTGTHTITFSAAGYESASPSTTVIDGSTSGLNISLVLSPVGGGTGTLKGTVMSAAGAKLKGAVVQVTGGPNSNTNKGGKYTVQNVPEGLQSVIASHPDHGNTTPIQVTIPAGSTVTLNITFDP